MRLNPYLTFDGKCKEGMEFYHSCLGGDLDVMTVEQAGQADQMPDKKDQVMHSSLISGDVIIMASDLIIGGEINNGNTTTLCINNGTSEEVEALMNKLAEGGKVNQPFQETFFGYYGDITDKYGFRWMFQADKEKE